MTEEILELTEEEFEVFDSNEKWNLLLNVKKIVKDLEVRAKKNCEECEKTYISPEDVNIDLLFQDWRECAEHCNECNEEISVNMCKTQMEVMNHVANSLLEVQRKQRLLTELVLKKDVSGSVLLKNITKKFSDNEKKKEKANTEMFL